MSEIKLGKHRGKYVAVYADETGRRQRRSLGTNDASLARTRLGEFRRTFALLSQPEVLTIAHIFESYVAGRRAEGIVSADRMDDAWKAMKATFADLLPSHITETLCLEYIKARRESGMSDGTIHTELTYLRAALAFAVKRDWITRAPYVPVPQKPDSRETFLTRAEAERLIGAAVMPHARLFILMALHTAGRAQAILDLTWARVDFKKRLIHLRDPEKARTAKGRATVPMTPTIEAALLEAQKGALSPYVIEWGGEKVGSIKKAVAAAAGRAGLDCSAHDLRRTAAVWMAESGVPMRKIALYLGHTNTMTTERVYAKHSPDFLEEAARAIEG